VVAACDKDDLLACLDKPAAEISTYSAAAEYTNPHSWPPGCLLIFNYICFACLSFDCLASCAFQGHSGDSPSIRKWCTITLRLLERPAGLTFTFNRSIKAACLLTGDKKVKEK
jgi:hypothetical protein